MLVYSLRIRIDPPLLPSAVLSISLAVFQGGVETDIFLCETAHQTDLKKIYKKTSVPLDGWREMLSTYMRKVIRFVKTLGPTVNLTKIHRVSSGPFTLLIRRFSFPLIVPISPSPPKKRNRHLFLSFYTTFVLYRQTSISKSSCDNSWISHFTNTCRRKCDRECCHSCVKAVGFYICCLYEDSLRLRWTV